MALKDYKKQNTIKNICNATLYKIYTVNLVKKKKKKGLETKDHPE